MRSKQTNYKPKLCLEKKNRGNFFPLEKIFFLKKLGNLLMINLTHVDFQKLNLIFSEGLSPIFGDSFWANKKVRLESIFAKKITKTLVLGTGRLRLGKPKFGKGGGLLGGKKKAGGGDTKLEPQNWLSKKAHSFPEFKTKQHKNNTPLNLSSNLFQAQHSLNSKKVFRIKLLEIGAQKLIIALN